jgi:hypothetical protein
MNIPVRFQVFFPREMNYKFCFPLNNVNFCHEVVVTFMINIQTIIVRNIYLFSYLSYFQDGPYCFHVDKFENKFVSVMLD